MFDTMVDEIAHQEMHVDGGASMQTFLYPAALQVRKIPNGGGSRSRTAYVIRNGRLTPGWDDVARSTPAIATRAVATLTTNSGVGDLYKIYALAKRDGVHPQTRLHWRRFRAASYGRVRSPIHEETLRIWAREGAPGILGATRLRF